MHDADESPDKQPKLCVLIDLDGTLVEIRSTPDAVRLSESERALIRDASQRLQGRFAIVSGRSLQQLDEIIGASDASLVLAGSHGQELRVNGRLTAPPATSIFAELARAASRRFEAHDGIVVEEKTFGLGVHFRRTPELADAVREWTSSQAQEHGLAVQRGDMLYEIRPHGANKGDAVRAIMALEKFTGGRPVYIGDDFTDIPAFEAARALGGIAMSVGSRVAAHADETLRDVKHAHDRLRELIE